MSSKTDSQASAAVASPGTNKGGRQPAKKKGEKKGKAREVILDVEGLSPELKETVDHELRQGGSFEEIHALVEAKEEVTLEPGALPRYFRHNPGLQAERFKTQLQRARELRRAMGSRPDSPEADFAFSALLMGLSGLSQREQRTATGNAMRVLKQGTDVRLKGAASQLQEKRIAIAETESRARMREMELKIEGAKLKLETLQKHIEGQGKEKALGPEIIQRINEVYGIITEPVSETASGQGDYGTA